MRDTQVRITVRPWNETPSTLGITCDTEKEKEFKEMEDEHV